MKTILQLRVAERRFFSVTAKKLPLLFYRVSVSHNPGLASLQTSLEYVPEGTNSGKLIIVEAQILRQARRNMAEESGCFS